MLLALLLGPNLMTAGVIPADRLVDWTAGSVTGVPGGVDQYLPGGANQRISLIDVTSPPHNADKTGGSDVAAALRSAVAAATSGQVVYFPAGTYRLDTRIAVTKSGITLRGQGTNTVIDFRGTYGGAFTIGSGTDWNWPKPPAPEGAVTGGGAAGSSTVTINSATTSFTVGRLLRFRQDNDTNSSRLPVIHVSAWNGLSQHKALLTSKSDRTLTFWPPLPFTLTNNPTVRYAQVNHDLVGVEDMVIDCSQSSSPDGLCLQQAYACWVKNVHIRKVANRSINLYNSLNCEIRDCWMDEIRVTGPNGAGLLIDRSSSCLIENNIIYKAFPSIEVVNGCTLNVFAFNYCLLSESSNLQGVSIDSNHGPQNAFNLYEGNIAGVFQSDGYFGGSSHDTVFRNWFHGWSPNTDNFSRCIALNRFTRNYNIVCNVLGMTDYNWVVNQSTNGYSYSVRTIYTFGYPNMGNTGYTSTAQPTSGDWWSDWAGYVVALPSNEGVAVGPTGWQERDLDVEPSTLLKGNWNAQDAAIPPAESLGVTSPPASLFRTSKPAYFHLLAWPPIQPESPTFAPSRYVHTHVAIIPAQARYYGLTQANRPAPPGGLRTE